MKKKAKEPQLWVVPRSHRIMSLQDLKWCKALVAAIASARSRGDFPDYPDALAVYKTPEHGYVVRAVNDVVTRMAWAAFVQALITSPDYGGHGEVLHRLPRGSWKVFPRVPPKSKQTRRRRAAA